MPFIAGTAASPSIRFNPDNHSGLYLRSVSDIAISVASSPVMSWNNFSVSSNLPIWLTSGTQAKPAIAFQSDQNVGFYKKAAGVWGYAVDNVAGPALSVQGLVLPAGTTAGRPGTPVANVLRANTDTAGLDLYVNGAWATIGGQLSFNSLAEADAYVCGVAPDVILLQGYYEAGDRGAGALYKRVNSQPGHPAKFSITENSLTVWFELIEQTYMNVGWFGVKGDNTLEDMDCIEAGLWYLSEIGGGTLYFPAGDYLLGQGSTANIAIHVDVNNVTLLGDGPAATRFKLADNQECHVVNFYNVINCGLNGIGINGNRNNQSQQVHGIRLQNVTNIYITNFLIEQTYHYAIGAQDGTISGVRISHGKIQNIGADCIDFKNKTNTNVRNFVEHVVIDTWGLNGLTTAQTGIDCRGPVSVSNISVVNPPNDGVGVRFREGETGVDVNGFGGHRSSLTQFDIRLGAAATGIGVVSQARDVTISNGYINGGLRGVQASGDRCHVTAVTTEGTTSEGIYFTIAGSLEADYSIATSCTAIGGTRGFRTAVDSTQFIGCWAKDNTTGFQTDATADATTIIGGGVVGTTTGVGDSGTNSRIRNVDGWKTEAHIETGSLTLDSTGSKTFSIPHGLPFTPDLKDVALTLIRETAVTDPVIVNVWVEATDSTIVQGRARVTTASATGAATFRIGIKVEGKNGA